MLQNLQQLHKDLDQRARHASMGVYLLEGQRSAVQEQVGNLSKEIDSRKALDLSYDKLQKFFQSLGTDEQQKLQLWVEQIITYGLQYVFGPTYHFKIAAPEIRGSEVAISFSVVDDSGVARDPFTEMGGGPADVLSFLLQFVLVHLLSDRCAQIIILDEAFKHLSTEKDYSVRMAHLLKELTDRTNMQIVIITHNQLYSQAADTLYKFTKDDKITQVEKL